MTLCAERSGAERERHDCSFERLFVQGPLVVRVELADEEVVIAGTARSEAAAHEPHLPHRKRRRHLLLRQPEGRPPHRGASPGAGQRQVAAERPILGRPAERRRRRHHRRRQFVQARDRDHQHRSPEDRHARPERGGGRREVGALERGHHVVGVVDLAEEPQRDVPLVPRASIARPARRAGAVAPRPPARRAAAPRPRTGARCQCAPRTARVEIGIARGGRATLSR